VGELSFLPDHMSRLTFLVCGLRLFMSWIIRSTAFFGAQYSPLHRIVPRRYIRPDCLVDKLAAASHCSFHPNLPWTFGTRRPC
jgi:hypothetical protein